MEERSGVASFRDLHAWQKAIDLSLSVYQLTRAFPREEMFGLTSQLRRASVSIASNIAEGSGRGTTRDLIHFLHMARGSICEVETQLLLARKLHLGTPGELETCEALARDVSRLVIALLRSLQQKVERQNQIH